MEAKRSYNEEFDNLRATELRLGLPGTDDVPKKPVSGNKRTFDELDVDAGSDAKQVEPKAQIVGWPPVRSYRKNSIQAKKAEAEAGGILVKVSMDGAPYLRKTDLKMYKEYKELREALNTMFKCFEGLNGSDCAITYEDKDGDWMLVGDVPWGMFVSSCKRLRIMRGSEARGLGSN
ncbi:uncharacterized protein A4U43_C07F31970 [Asparagus officinalis]|uniref:Auxin-responsive protein n=1 Tax=Asparagus officinalis TaxID=4686 RepID=A0A5P1EGJ7_ASPOF|nr:auxin-induced protein 22D-like [Asparagus officinalis]ONK64964.1 uncharacterized protein A4U43_C07F31970 [Asparagus officinalis]